MTGRFRAARLAAAGIIVCASSALAGISGAAFEYGPVGEPILSATFRVDLAGLNAPVHLAGHQINMAMLVTRSGESYDMTTDLFGAAVALAPNETQVFEAAIDASFFGALAAGRMGLWMTLTDTDDASFAIDYISLEIETLSDTFELFYGSMNDGFGLAIADNGALGGAVRDVLPPNSTGTGFDETVSSKSIHVVPTPGAGAALLAGLGAFARRRRRDAAGVALAAAAAAGLVGAAPAASAETQVVWLDFENQHTPADGRLSFINVSGGPADGGDVVIRFRARITPFFFTTFATITVDTDAGDTPEEVTEKIHDALKSQLSLNKLKNHGIAYSGTTGLRLAYFLRPEIVSTAGMTIERKGVLIPETGGPKGLKDSPVVAALRTRLNQGLPADQQMSIQQVANMLKTDIKKKVEEMYDCLDVEFTATEPDDRPYSVISFVSCAKYRDGATLGVVEQIDRTNEATPAKNTNRTDKGWVFLDEFQEEIWDIQGGSEVQRHMTKEELANTIAKTAAHEFGHLCGEFHNRNWPICFKVTGAADGTNFRFRLMGKLFSITTTAGDTATMLATKIQNTINNDAAMMTAGASVARVGAKVLIAPGKGEASLRITDTGGHGVMGDPTRTTPTRAGCMMDSGYEVQAVTISAATRTMMETSLGKKAKPAQGQAAAPPTWSGHKVLGDFDFAGLEASYPGECYAEPDAQFADLSLASQDPEDVGTGTDTLLGDGQLHQFLVPTPFGPGNPTMASLTIGIANVLDDGSPNGFTLHLDGVEIPGAFDLSDYAGDSSFEGRFAEFQFQIPPDVLALMTDGELVVGLGVPPGRPVVVDYLMVFCATDYTSPDPDQLHLVAPPVAFAGEMGFIEAWVQAEFEPVWGRSVIFEPLTENVGMADDFIDSDGSLAGDVTGLDGFIEATTFAIEPGQAAVRVSVGDSSLEAFAVFNIVDTYTGDTDLDGEVGFSDLNAVLVNYGQTRQRGQLLPGDANGDQIIDFADLNIVLVNFGRTID